MTQRASIVGLLAICGFLWSQGCGAAEPAGDLAAGADASSSTSSSGGGSSSSSSGSAAELDAGVGEPCDGTCQATTLTVTLGANTGTFDRVQFGFTGSTELHLEAHRGGDSACPQERSPSPDFTLVLDVPRTGTSAPITRDDGLSVGFLDFSGAIDPELPPAKVIVATLTPVAWTRAGDDPVYAFDLRAEFAQGAVIDGHGFARHCDSLDELP